MKKIFLSLGAFLGSYYMVNAQDTQTQTQTQTTSSTPTQTNPVTDGSSSSVYFGARYLATFTNFNLSQSNGAYSTSLVLGQGWEGLVGIDFGNHVGLQAELLYSSLAQNYTDQYDVERKITLNYVQIPVLLVLNTNTNAPVNFHVEFGPQWGFNVASKVESNGAATGDTISGVVKAKPMDFGIAYGAGLDFKLVQYLYLNIGYRGVEGLVDINDDTETIGPNQYYVLKESHITTYALYAGLSLKF